MFAVLFIVYLELQKNKQRVLEKSGGKLGQSPEQADGGAIKVKQKIFTHKLVNKP